MASFFFQSQWNWIFVEELYTGTPAAPRPSWPLMDGQMSASQPDSAPLQTAESLKHALSGVVFDHVSGYRNPFSWTNDTCWLNRPWPLTCIYTVTMIDIPFSLMAEMPLFLFVFHWNHSLICQHEHEASISSCVLFQRGSTRGPRHTVRACQRPQQAQRDSITVWGWGRLKVQLDIIYIMLSYLCIN